MAALASLPDRRGIRIFLGWRGRPRYRSAAELLRDDADTSNRHGYLIRTRSGVDWERRSLDPWLNQFINSVAAFGRRRAGRCGRLLARATAPRTEAQSGHRCDRNVRRIAAGLVRHALSGGKAINKHCSSRRACAQGGPAMNSSQIKACRPFSRLHLCCC